MLNQLYQSLIHLRQFLENENALIQQNKLREVRDNMSQKEMLWDQYLQLFDQAAAEQQLQGPGRRQILDEMRHLTQLSEENQALIQEVLQSLERSVGRFMSKNASNSNGPNHTYNRNGRLAYGNEKSSLHRPAAFAINQTL